MRFKRAGIMTKLVILILIVYAVISLIGLQSRIEEAEQATAQLSAAVENKALTNKELAYAIEHSSDPETIERVARDKLGLVYPGEQIFYDVNGN